jgi:hypothetical protein
MAQLLSPSSSLQSGKQTQTAVERIAAFVAAAQPEQLRPEIRQLFKRNILDSIGCAIAALPGPPFTALREQFKEYRAPDHCTLIDGGKTSADQAALYNSGLVRYVDLLDSYMSPGGLCHPSDNFGAVLAAAEQAGATDEEFMLALAVAYEIQCRFTAAVPVMAKGFNHAIQLAMSAAAATGKLFGLSAGQIEYLAKRRPYQCRKDIEGWTKLILHLLSFLRSTPLVKDAPNYEARTHYLGLGLEPDVYNNLPRCNCAPVFMEGQRSLRKLLEVRSSLPRCDGCAD